jgi:hypothetical protein
MEHSGRAFFPLRATSANCASEASTSPSGELCDEVGGYNRAMREQQAQKSCDEIESNDRHFVTDIVILAWQNMSLRAVPPAPPASQWRLHRNSGVRLIRQFLPRSVHQTAWL